MNFSLHKGTKLEIQISDKESDAVKIAVQNLETDIQKVISGIQIAKSCGDAVIHIATDNTGKPHKETYQIKVQDGELYITGSDRRGTVYGIYSFCEWMRVSPWYFFADV
ncbi:MAG: glycoside hydrolase family 20 zincin-like fold domain-containing protein, partial [Lachnospiraceae bacterium]|nr:glycoside hydrolase family 20 zincin-like fold domain-containing protein [Lachnospiraceae bacterium]